MRTKEKKQTFLDKLLGAKLSLCELSEYQSIMTEYEKKVIMRECVRLLDVLVAQYKKEHPDV